MINIAGVLAGAVECGDMKATLGMDMGMDETLMAAEICIDTVCYDV